MEASLQQVDQLECDLGILFFQALINFHKVFGKELKGFFRFFSSNVFNKLAFKPSSVTKKKREMKTEAAETNRGWGFGRKKGYGRVEEFTVFF
ncbi:hypothetical protein C1H46_031645 [Malus baccata]|uniref:Uncharacterized protein n=1 Tax=Malus baccata TaxID=106549 RepID=A0A540L8L5_MALBA|nr:hypothetical protein C1H46_031645 [Malus baccata]